MQRAKGQIVQHTVGSDVEPIVSLAGRRVSADVLANRGKENVIQLLRRLGHTFQRWKIPKPGDGIVQGLRGDRDGYGMKIVLRDDKSQSPVRRDVVFQQGDVRWERLLDGDNSGCLDRSQPGVLGIGELDLDEGLLVFAVSCLQAGLDLTTLLIVERGWTAARGLVNGERSKVVAAREHVFQGVDFVHRG